MQQVHKTKYDIKSKKDILKISLEPNLINLIELFYQKNYLCVRYKELLIKEIPAFMGNDYGKNTNRRTKYRNTALRKSFRSNYTCNTNE